ncbi:DoxX family protein [Neorhizobium sp. DT-125]|uniref:DoxX family protein n=1 Tax=Neorhizobium sp. DT-125 TaxID=3396163 RepID=UPI003F1DAE51
MNKFAGRQILAWAVSAFFVLGGAMNIVAPTFIMEDYARWGYPAWFHYVTGALELLCAGLLVPRKTRAAGAILGVLVMGSAVLTLAVHGEWTHVVLPALVLIALAAICFGSRDGESLT